MITKEEWQAEIRASEERTVARTNAIIEKNNETLRGLVDIVGSAEKRSASAYGAEIEYRRREVEALEVIGAALTKLATK